MSTARRKARKRAGVKFEKAPHVGTPVAERAENMPKLVKLGAGGYMERTTSRAKRRLAARGIEAKGASK